MLVSLTEHFDKCNCCRAISAGSRIDCDITLTLLDSTIIGLSLPEIGHIDGNTLVHWPPYITTRIIPTQMAFIDIKYNQITCFDRYAPGVQTFANLFFFAATSSGSLAGLARWAFFQEIRAAASNSC